MFSKEWVMDNLSPNYGVVCRIKKPIYKHQSKFQKIEIVDTYEFGKLLILDGAFQTAEKEEAPYHECIVHPPLLIHPRPKNILIIGGGDGGALREVLRHPVSKVVMVEIDKEVVEVCQKYLPINRGAFEDKRTELIFTDGAEYLKKVKNAFDVIIIDSTDPVKQGKHIFNHQFHKNVFTALKADGVAARQSGSPLFQLPTVRRTYRSLKKIFPYVELYLADIPLYGGNWSFTIGFKVYFPGKLRKLRFPTQYYNNSFYQGARCLPEYLSEYLSK